MVGKKRKQNQQKERPSKYFSLNITLLLRAHASTFWDFLLCSFFLFLSFSFFHPFKKKLSHKNARTNNNKTYQESRQFRVKTQVNESIQELEALKYTYSVNKITSRTPDSLQISYKSFCSKEQPLKQSVTLLKEFCPVKIQLFECPFLSCFYHKNIIVFISIISAFLSFSVHL